MTDKKIISFNEFKNREQLKNIDYAQIDWNNPQSIINYGKDILDSFKNVEDEIPTYFNTEVVRSYEFYDPLEKIDKFNESIAQRETTQQKKLKQNKIASGFFKTINRLTRGRVDVLQENEDYTKTFKEYIKNLKAIADMMKKDKDNLMGETTLFSLFKEYIQYLSENLKQAIEDGETKIATYEAEINKDSDENDTRKIYVSVAKDRISSLRTTLEIMKGIINQIDLKSAAAFSQMIKYEEYIQITSPTLALYGNLAVGIKSDTNRIDRLEKTRNMANETITTSTERLNDNVSRIMELSKEDMITESTITKVAESFIEGAKIIDEANKQKIQNQEQLKNKFQEFDKIFEQYHSVLTQSLLGHERYGSPKVKTLGRLNARK